MKIITIHGTFAGHQSDSGQKWWQLGSKFNQLLTAPEHSTSPQIVVEPFHWSDGPNSEFARRKFGLKLFDRLEGLERKNESYILLAHSHGGSVIHHALIASIRKGRELNNLKKYITVGTPFLHMRKNSFLYSRLNFFGKVIFLYGAISCLLGAGTLGLLRELNNEGPILVNPTLPVGLVSALTVAWIILSLGLLSLIGCYLVDRIWSSNIDNDVGQKCAELYEARWIGYNHDQDEVLSLFRWLQDAKGVILNKQSFAGSVAFFVTAIFVFLILVFSTYLLYTLLPLEIRLEPWKYDIGVIFKNIAKVSFASNIVGLLAMFATISFIFVPMIAFLAVGVGRLLSPCIASVGDDAVWTSLRSSLFGSDIQSETVFTVSTRPIHFNKKIVPISKAALDEMEDKSRQEIQRAAMDARKFFSAAAEMGLSNNLIAANAKSIMSWNEVFHTAYFNSEKFALTLKKHMGV